MAKLKIQVTKQDRLNLITFLNRTQLNGAEVEAYLRLVKAINESLKKEK